MLREQPAVGKILVVADIARANSIQSYADGLGCCA